jgi:hypothetical protein
LDAWSPQLRRTPTEKDFEHLLFFSGKMNLNWGRAYALGVRQVTADTGSAGSHPVARATL